MPKNNVPLPTPKPWLRGSAEIMAQASSKMSGNK